MRTLASHPYTELIIYVREQSQLIFSYPGFIGGFFVHRNPGQHLLNYDVNSEIPEEIIKNHRAASTHSKAGFII